MTDKHIRRTASDYAAAFAHLLPTGVAWPRDPASVLQTVVTGLAKIWGDDSGSVDHRAADLLEIESDPRITVELLSDWERAWGLPDECLPVPPSTIAGRQDALVYKMTLLGAQSRAFFLAQAALLGATIEIKEYAPFPCGYARCGDTKSYYDGVEPRWELGPSDIRSHWTVTLHHTLTGVECMFRRYKPAHTELIFRYVAAVDRVASVYYFLGI